MLVITECRGCCHFLGLRSALGSVWMFVVAVRCRESHLFVALAALACVLVNARFDLVTDRVDAVELDFGASFGLAGQGRRRRGNSNTRSLFNVLLFLVFTGLLVNSATYFRVSGRVVGGNA